MSLFREKLRYLQTLSNISAENNSTIVFPVPVDLVSQFVQRKMVSMILSTAASNSILSCLEKEENVKRMNFLHFNTHETLECK